MSESQSKNCRKCAQSKTRSEFHRNKQASDGFHSYCKVCRSRQKPTQIAVKRERDAINSRRLDYEQWEERKKMVSFARSVLRQYGEKV